MSINIDDIIEYFLNNTEPPSSPEPPAPTRDEDEPSFSEYEAHVNGTKLFSGEVLRKLNQNPAWQKKLAMFRKHTEGAHLLPIAAETFARIGSWLDRQDFLPQLQLVRASGTGAPPAPAYNVALEDEHAQPLSSERIEIHQGPLVTNDGHLVFSVQIPKFPSELRPVQLIVLSIPEREIISTLELLEMDQVLRLTIPADLASQERWNSIDPKQLPFAFVLRVGRKRTLTAS